MFALKLIARSLRKQAVIYFPDFYEIYLKYVTVSIEARL